MGISLAHEAISDTSHSPSRNSSRKTDAMFTSIHLRKSSLSVTISRNVYEALVSSRKLSHVHSSPTSSMRIKLKYDVGASMSINDSTSLCNEKEEGIKNRVDPSVTHEVKSRVVEGVGSHFQFSA